MWKTLCIQEVFHGHFVTGSTVTLSPKATVTLSHKPIDKEITYSFPIVLPAVLWKSPCWRRKRRKRRIPLYARLQLALCQNPSF